jgi:hypothetical protein
MTLEQTKASGTYRHAQLWIGDDDTHIYNGFIKKQRWNGWEMPAFTKEEADVIIAVFNEDKNSGAAYIPHLDAYVVVFDVGGPGEHHELYTGFDIVVSGRQYHVYGLGAGSWIWEEWVPDEDELEEETNE